MKLPLQVTFRNVPEDGLEEYIREQAEKLERYYDGIMSCQVLVELRGRHRQGNAYHVRIDLRVPDRELLVKHEPGIHASLQDEETEKAAKATESAKRPKTPRRAILDAFADMRRQLQDYARNRRGQVKQHPEALPAGTVERLFPEEGYGFLTSPEGNEVYFHRNSVIDGFDQLRVGTQVHYTEEPGEKGPQASTVHIVHPRKQTRAAAESVTMRRVQR